jgi:alpha-beta hydrolase superfamily lysophospholipase
VVLAIVAAAGAAMAAPPDPAAESFRRAWQVHAEVANAGPLQPGCAATFLPAQGQRRGAVLALHGFGGCAQQFTGVAPRLAAEGFDVLMPRLPGHGRPPAADGREDLTGVPTAADWQARYDGFIAGLDGVMQQSPGTRVLLGFSAGGALALRAVAQQPGRYQRLVLLAPLTGIRGGAAVERLAWQLGRVPGLAALDVKHFGPRAECEAWQATGRGGFCGYELRHAAGLVGLARAVRSDWQDRALPLPTLLLIAGTERYVSNEAALGFAAAQGLLGAPLVATVLPGVPHEMLTPYENVGRNMDWLPGLEALVVAGVTGTR